MRLVSSHALLLCACALLAACGNEGAPLREWRPEDHGEPAQLGDQAEAEAPSTDERAPEQGGSERAAEALFNVTCANCHGRDGRGGGPGMPPGAQVPDFTSAELQKSRTDEALAQVIRDGRGMMPPFGKQVTPDGISVLVAHVRKLGGVGPVQPTASPGAGQGTVQPPAAAPAAVAPQPPAAK